MAKINLKFNNQTYSIDESVLAAATAELEAHLTSIAGERLEGDGAEFYTLAPTALSFRSTAPLNELQSVQINGVTVDPSNYTLEEGSTIVTFPIDYLKTFDVGNYEVIVASDSKTVKGNFTVAAPELNEYGFYYNQPYSAWVDYFQANTIFFIREDNTIDVIVSGAVETCPYTIDGNIMTVTTSGMGDVHLAISADSIECVELATNFVINNECAVADKDYIYIYKEDLSGYEVQCIDKTKAEYDAIKKGVCNRPIKAIGIGAFTQNTNLVTIPEISEEGFGLAPSYLQIVGEYAFSYCTNLIEAVLPASVRIIGYHAFSHCSKLAHVEMPTELEEIYESSFIGCTNLTEVVVAGHTGHVKIGVSAFSDCTSLATLYMSRIDTIGSEAFKGCTALTNIIFNGTVSEWNAIAKGNDLFVGVSATYVQCSDGQVAL